MIILTNVKLPLETDFSALKEIAASLLKVGCDEILSATLYKKSVDARRKTDVHFCVSILVKAKEEGRVLKKNKNACLFENKEYKWRYDAVNSKTRPIVVGFGPAGMFAALTLARAGLKPIVIERGSDIDCRSADVQQFFKDGVLKTDSNVQFGEGGAGTFSDGKLNTGIKDIRCRAVLSELVRFGAPNEILVDSKPHIGTDILKTVVKNIRNEIIALGGEVRFDSKLDNFIFNANGKLEAAVVNGVEITAERLVLAIGHSARDTFKVLKQSQFSLERKPFAMGVRIEHLQSDINKAMYGDFAESPYLSAADYKLAVHLESGRGVYSFCMCSGGEVVNASSEAEGIAVNGMSYNARAAKNANSALLVGIEPSELEGDDVLEGCYLQRKIEQRAYKVARGAVPITTVGEFVYGKPQKIGRIKPTVKPKARFADFDDIFPKFITDSLREGIKLMDEKIAGFACEDSILTAPETRSSSPVRIIRDESGQALKHIGIFPSGEGAGYAGGIMSAAVDGIKSAEKLIESL